MTIKVTKHSPPRVTRSLWIKVMQGLVEDRGLKFKTMVTGLRDNGAMVKMVVFNDVDTLTVTAHWKDDKPEDVLLEIAKAIPAEFRQFK